MNKTIFLYFLLIGAIVGCTQQAGTISGVEIIDGDTFRLANGDTVRLIGIDAPELSQPGGVLSREYLAYLILANQLP